MKQIKQKAVLCIILMLTLAFPSCAMLGGNGGEQSGEDTSDSAALAPESTSTELEETTTAPEEVADNEAINRSNIFMAHDQKSKYLRIYDLSSYKGDDDLDSYLVWSVRTGHAAGLKYRQDTVFGDVIINAGELCAIISYPSGKRIWGSAFGGNNPHSVELLPSGNLIIASSTGGTLRVFRTSALLGDSTIPASSYIDYPLEGAHGVLWDPEYKVLWAVGNYELKAYEVRGDGVNEVLVELPEMSVSLPDAHPHGHDLSPDYSSTRYLYITTNSCLLKYDKEEKKFLDDFDFYSEMNRTAIKGFSNNLSGSFFITGPTGGAGTSWSEWGNASWCTDTIYFCTVENGTLTKHTLVSKECAYYKARAFCGLYQ